MDWGLFSKATRHYQGHAKYLRSITLYPYKVRYKVHTNTLPFFALDTYVTTILFFHIPLNSNDSFTDASDCYSPMQMVYYVAMLQDFVLRFAWTVTLTVSYDILRMNQTQKDILVTFVAILEVYRQVNIRHLSILFLAATEIVFRCVLASL